MRRAAAGRRAERKLANPLNTDGTEGWRVRFLTPPDFFGAGSEQPRFELRIRINLPVRCRAAVRGGGGAGGNGIVKITVHNENPTDLAAGEVLARWAEIQHVSPDGDVEIRIGTSEAQMRIVLSADEAESLNHGDMEFEMLARAR